MIAQTHDPMHVLWPPERFYWALVDASVLPRRGLKSRRRSRELAYLFEEVVPVPLEQLQLTMVAVTGSPDQYIICGIEREVLRQDLFVDAITLRPTALPPFLSHLADVVDCDRLNLLKGEHLPKPLARLQRQSRWESLAAILALVVLVVIGMERRTGSFNQQTQALLAAQGPIYEQVLGPSMGHSTQPPALQLTGELRRLRQTRSAQAPEVDAMDLTPELARLLAMWPAIDQVNALTQSISVTPGSILIRVLLPDTQQSQQLIEAIREMAKADGANTATLPRWVIQQPTIRAAKEGVDAEVRFTAANVGERSP